MILPDRKRPPHLTPLDNKPVVLLITVCTKNRRRILAHEWVHELLRRSWERCSEFPVGRYVIMPDHIHFFVGENHAARYQLANWIAAWKSFVSLRWPTPKDKPIWQRSFWDRQIRSGDAYDQKWLYVKNNPVRHELVRDPDDWRFQGSMNSLSW